MVKPLVVPFRPHRLCRNAKASRFVIPNEVTDLVFSATYEYKIPRLRLEMTVATQSGTQRSLKISFQIFK